MKLRSYLFLANIISVGFILFSLFYVYDHMKLTKEDFYLLSSVTIGASLLSFIIHFIVMHPVQKSLRLIREQAKRISEGDFQGEVPNIGPKEFKALAVQFNEMNEKLDESFRKITQTESSRRELVANVSHDLRTPLASIQSYVEALQDDVIQDKNKKNEYLNTIQMETKRLGNLIEDLFHLSRLDAGADHFEPEPSYIDPIIIETLQGFAIQIEEKGLDVSVNIPDNSPKLSMMPNKIIRVLQNLIGNAIRHSPKGSTLELSIKNIDGQKVLVSVKDEGEGLPTEEKERIFERFYRTDKSRNRYSGGSGLGLAIAKGIIDLHGGEIGVDSEEGKGSRFWFTLQLEDQ
ncbi:sensor histidine kinase [Chengkuizengella axinellae]|uniref:histidine kinase n=1 Tax=Chengkuizengella axinellae TaxID=3064388 RepID=A0ABT9IY24_9BACL|nr:ATP-binding protein [Chengkuizengella sp. 2205SS18-9]MDP5273704.1 ATP-binding protein [Chengkuizengella sp. 2205SS18-9]